MRELRVQEEGREEGIHQALHDGVGIRKRVELDSHDWFVMCMGEKDICCHDAGCLDDDFDYTVCPNCGAECLNCSFML